MKKIELTFSEEEYALIKSAAGRSGKSIRGFILDICRQLDPDKKRGKHEKNISHVRMERRDRLPPHMQRMPELHPDSKGKKNRT